MRATSRRQVAVWISASALLLALVGAMQFRWIRQVNQSQRLLATESLEESLEGVVADLETRVWALLAAFRSNAGLELASRPDYYKQIYHLWHELAWEGPAVARVLILDLAEGGVDRLWEVGSGRGSFGEVAWDEDLAQIGAYIQKHGFRRGRGVKARWTATWMYIPGAMALCRPMAAHVQSARSRQDWPAVTGYLILQLDRDYIRDRLIPKVLGERFRDHSDTNGPYEVRIALDGESLFSYGRLERRREEKPASVTPASNLRLDWHEKGREPVREGAPDRAVPFMLSHLPVTAAVEPLGVAQRIWVQRHTNPGLLSELFLAPEDHALWPAEAGGGRNRPRTADVIRRQGGMPRLFLVSEKGYEMTLEARRAGMPLAEAMNRSYAGSLVLGISALVLLLAATSAVAVTLSRAARRAETRTDAAASLAHQLLTPIAAILFLAENLADGVQGPGTSAARYGGLIRHYGRRLKTIAEQSMRMSAMDSYERRYKLVMLDASKAVEEAFADAAPIFEDAGFEAECACAEGLPMVLADAEALGQSLGDLLSNAVKYGAPGNWVRVEAVEAVARGRREVQIRIHDRGPGISSHEATKIFEPFYRIANESSASVPGAGLGLKLAAEAVKGMGGTLTLESEEGVGSVFTIHLPVPDRAA